MIPRFILTLIGVAALIGAIVFVKGTQFSAMGAAQAAMVMPPDTVTAATVNEDTWEDSLAATGSLVAVQGVTVSAEVAGKITRLAFEPGATVAAGDLLVQLDTSTEEAQLASADASVALAEVNLKRQRDLRAQNTNSPSDLDAADAQAKQAASAAATIRAIIAKKTIRAPFAGRLGLRYVNLGQNLNAGDAISSLQTLDPIYVNFSLPQQKLPLLKTGGAVRLATDVAPGEKFEGRINAISPEVDPATRSVRVQATLANPTEKLRPGVFASVEIVLPSVQRVLAIPATAVLYSPSGDSVFVIEEKKDAKTGKPTQTLRQQFVQLGGTRGDFVNVTSGLKAGEQIVTSGVFKLRAGGAVVIDNTYAPKAKQDPSPSNS
jgi:membrane fusion protein (multidrug efflux system)